MESKKIIEFKDQESEYCSIQKSSKDGCVFFGRNYNRMHLSKEEVMKLLPILEKFLETGDIE